MSVSEATDYRFGDFSLDVASLRLCQAGAPVSLERRPALLLLLLLRHAGKLVPRSLIVSELWGNNVHVETELGMNTAVRKLRRALGDNADDPAFVETVPRLGYRFIAEVRVSAPARRHLLAVLPFEDLSFGEERYEHLACGFTEDTIARLGQVAPDRLCVLGRVSTTSLRQSGHDAASVARELGADYLVEASFRAEAGRLRVVAKLIEGRSHRQVWSESYDAEPSRILAFQDLVSRTIATRISLHLTDGGAAGLLRRQSTNAAAFELYTRGPHLWQGHSRATNEAAIRHYREALTLDPDYALAWAGLAETLGLAPVTADVAPSLVCEEASHAAARGVASGPHLVETWTARGFIRFWLERDWPGAEQDFRRAIAIDCNYGFAQRMLGVVLSHGGIHAEARQAIQRACELDPLYAMHHALASQIAFQARDYVEAAEHARHAIVVGPDFWIGHHMLAQARERLGDHDGMLAASATALGLGNNNSKTLGIKAYALAQRGRTSEATAILEACEIASTVRYVPPQPVALMLLGLGRHEAALSMLERALSVGDVNLHYLTQDPKFDPLRGHPRFEALLERAGLRAATNLHPAAMMNSAWRHTGAD